jgi:hypothetical protein
MRLGFITLAIFFGALAYESNAQYPVKAQCPAPAVVYSGESVYYGGHAGYAPYGAYYAPPPAYLPFSTRRPTYPALSSMAPPARYGSQSTYFRGASTSGFAPPGGTFFGGYDYQITYPANWFGGYWGGW